MSHFSAALAKFTLKISAVNTANIFLNNFIIPPFNCLKNQFHNEVDSNAILKIVIFL
jgi:lipid A disaccharide synthetase